MTKAKGTPRTGRPVTVGDGSGKDRRVYLSDADMATAKSLGDGSASAGIRAALAMVMPSPAPAREEIIKTIMRRESDGEIGEFWQKDSVKVGDVAPVLSLTGIWRVIEILG